MNQTIPLSSGRENDGASLSHSFLAPFLRRDAKQLLRKRDSIKISHFYGFEMLSKNRTTTRNSAQHHSDSPSESETKPVTNFHADRRV